MEAMKLGTENLKKVLALVVEMGNVGDKMGHTNGAAKYLELANLFDELAALGSVDFKQIVPEFKDLDAVEKQEILAFAKDKLALVDKDLEAKIEECLGLVVDMASVIDRAITLVQSFKKAE